MKRVTPLILLLALVPLACGGGGGGKKTSASAYANDVCTAASDWVGALRKGSSEIGTKLNANSTPQEGKQVLQKFLGDAVTSTQKFVTDIKRAGTPDTGGGKKFADSLRQGADRAERALETAKSQSDELPTGSEAAFTGAASKLAAAANKALRSVSTTIGDKQGGDLRKAFQSNSTCKSVGSG